MSVDPTETAMDCEELTRSLDAYLDGELASPEEAEAVQHLDACAACRKVAEREGRVRTALRQRLKATLGPGTPQGRAPEELVARIREALRRERRPLWRRLLAPVPLAALAACAAGVLLVVLTHGGADALAEEAVRKHTRDLPLEVTAAAIGPESVARWFSGKLDFNAAPPRFKGGEVRLVGARLSNIQDRPAAYMRYEVPHGQFGLFILDDPERRFGEAGRALQVGPATVRVVNSRGYNVAVWRRNAIVYSLVTDLDEDDLARLVQTAQGLGER
jgi:anti-sigma factor RsiW